MTTEELIQEREHLLKEYSDKQTRLNDFWNLSNEKQITLVNYCLTAFSPVQAINKECTSYGLKHVFANYPFGFYSHNDQFKAGMLLAGYLPQDKKAINWSFSISKNSTGIRKPWYQYFKHCL